MNNDQTKTEGVPKFNTLISKSLLATFVSRRTERAGDPSYGPYEVVFRTTYEVWLFADGNGGANVNLSMTTTRNGIVCGSSLDGSDYAKKQIEKVREEIRRMVVFISKAETSLHVRFTDINRSIDDLPEISYDGQAWVPYTCTRVPHGDSPGHHVEYRPKGSPSVTALGRVGKTTGDVITFWPGVMTGSDHSAAPGFQE